MSNTPSSTSSKRLPATPRGILADTGHTGYKSTGYREQYARQGAAKLTPFLGIDADIAAGAAALEANAQAALGRRFAPLTGDEDR